MIKSMAMISVFMGVIPFLLGLLYTGFAEEEKNNPLLHISAGYVIMFGIFEILALPLIWQKQSLSLLVNLYAGILLACSVAALVLNWRRLPGIFANALLAVREFTLCIWAQLALAAGQVFVYVRYQYANADDSFFVAAASTALSTNTIFAYNPYTGAAYKNLPSRYVLSPFYAFTATMSKLTDTHPAILAHSVFMILFLLLAYAVYALIGRALFERDMEKLGYFMILASALNIFAAYSERTSGVFFLIRLWQGKALLAGVLLPMVLYMALRVFIQEGKRADYGLLFVLMCACCMVSSMGIMLGAVMLGIIGILFAWREKSVRILFHSFLCCLPNVFCASVYLLIR